MLLTLLGASAGCREDPPYVEKDPQAELPDASPQARPRTSSSGHLGQYHLMKYPDVPYVRPACLKRNDCPAPESIPTCILHRPALSLEKVRANSDVLRGQVVTIRAPLLVPRVWSTLVDCPGGCCNSKSGGVALDLGSSPDDFIVRLWNYRARGRFGCAGDDLLLCCGVPIDGRTVLSTGVLRQIEHSDDSSLQPGWYLDDAEVCVEP